jgi:hypothetical protein
VNARQRATARHARRLAPAAARRPGGQPQPEAPRASGSLRVLPAGDRDEARAVGAAGTSVTLPAIPPEIAEQLRTGRLEQSCGTCGRWEAAGFSCTGCGRETGPDDWYRNGDEDRRAVAHEKAAEKARTRVKRPRGRPARVEGHSAPAIAFTPELGFWPAG